MHFAIEAFGAAIGIKNDRRIVVETARAAFKDRYHDGSFRFSGDSGERFSRGAGDGLSQIEKRSVFTLAEILRAKKLWQADHLCALLCSGTDFFHRPANVVVGVG